MDAVRWTLVGLLAAGCLGWLAFALRARRVVRAVEPLPPPPREAPAWPRLALVVPACNEERTLGPATESRLRDDYPNLEIVLVDDRSTDGTGRVAAELAAKDPRVRVVRVETLPAGWLGKVHALREGVRATDAEWLLFTDADVHFAPGTLRRAVGHALRRGLDHLALVPAMEPRGALTDGVTGFAALQLCAGARVWAVEDPRSDAALGVGAFNLVRRAALERSEGLEWLRLEVADDLGLVRLLKRAGARCSVASGRDCVRVVWYESLRAMASAMARAGFTSVGRCSPARCLAAGAAAFLAALAPWAALAAPGVPDWLRALGALAIASLVAAGTLVAAWLGQPRRSALAWPAAPFVLATALALAGVRALRRGGIEWRGTFYATKELRTNLRIRLRT